MSSPVPRRAEYPTAIAAVLGIVLGLAVLLALGRCGAQGTGDRAGGSTSTTAPPAGASAERRDAAPSGSADATGPVSLDESKGGPLGRPRGWPGEFTVAPGSRAVFWGEVGDQSGGVNMTLSMTSRSDPVTVVSYYHSRLVADGEWGVEASPNVAKDTQEGADVTDTAWLSARKGRLRVAVVAAVGADGRTAAAVHVTEED